ncbi:MAG: histidine phosphatase family protein [Candidatus Tectomicrobia bacterium]|uniref:Histidine phosphatase family protein n=1 Tax=Tectimicrobiota bacterium TaxID=2528274 RepID=A0A933LQW8_UNCTE|nr:histidine phosphatase family protein [Candidatus Tectomicrobia bacterium]
MMKLYLIRHGQTEWNQQEIFRGLADVALDQEGRREARALAKRLQGTEIAAIFSSPLMRAKETADIIGNVIGLETVVSNELIDINCGNWQGVTLQEVKQKYYPLYQSWLQEPENFTFPLGEGLSEVRKRTIPFLKGLIERFPQKEIAVVSHRVINKIIICALLDLPNSKFWSIKQDTAALNLLELSPTEAHLMFLNDTCHLREIHLGTDKLDF